MWGERIMMKLIILVGCSASGKDFLMKNALATIPELNPIISHTSRPIRKGEKDGVEYHFVDVPTVTDMLNNGEFIEYRHYNVANGTTWTYGIHKGSVDVNSDNKYITIVDLQGLKKIEKYFDKLGMKECIHSIYIDTDAQLRLQRSLNREGDITEEQCKEIIRRFENDTLFVLPAREYCDISLKNNSVENAIQIIDYIRRIVEDK